MSGWKDWEIGEVVTEGEFQSFVQDQVVQRYADSAARTSALGTAVAEGMVSYLDDSNKVEVYNGTAWTDFSGDITAVTAGTGLSGGGTAGDVTLSADYAAIGSALALTTGTAGFTALSNGTAGISYQPVSPNYIINGAFDFWQRGTSFTANGFTSDRWQESLTTLSGTITRENATPADITAIGFGEPTFILKYVRGLESAALSLLETRLEDVRTLAGQTVTLSYYARVESGTAVNEPNFVQNFGSGGSAQVVTSTTNAVTMTTSWQRFSHTITLPSISGKTIGASSYLSLRPLRHSTSSATTYFFWGVQLEAGSIATPFKRHAPSLQAEEAACQRYYQKIAGDAFGSSFATGYIATTTSARVFVPIPTTMRTSPTMTVSGTATITFDGTALTPSSYSNILQYGNAIKVHAAVTGAVGNHACSWNFASGVIEFSAEL